MVKKIKNIISTFFFSVLNFLLALCKKIAAKKSIILMKKIIQEIYLSLGNRFSSLQITHS